MIKQGVKAAVATQPTQIRVTYEQLDVLKVMAVMEGTTVSGIIRDAIEAYFASNPLTDAQRGLLDGRRSYRETKCKN